MGVESDETILMHNSASAELIKLQTMACESLLRCDMSAAEQAGFHEVEQEEEEDEKKGPKVSGDQCSCASEADQMGCGANCKQQQQQQQQANQKIENQVLTIKKAVRSVEVRLLVRRREAGALIGKRGANIKRLREHFKEATFNIPDTGNGPERVACIATNSLESLDAILTDVTQLFQEKHQQQHRSSQSDRCDQLTRRLSSSTSNSSSSTSSQAPKTSLSSNNEHEQQIEMKLLINSSHAGLLIGLGGQSIRKLRNVSVRGLPELRKQQAAKMA